MQAPAAPAAPVPAPVPPINWMELLQIGHLIRLIIFYCVFTYNRSYSDEKKLYIALSMCFVYLIQVGFFKWILKRICDKFAVSLLCLYHTIYIL